jgi:hypothetical protein
MEKEKEKCEITNTGDQEFVQISSVRKRRNISFFPCLAFPHPQQPIPHLQNLVILFMQLHGR